MPPTMPFVDIHCHLIPGIDDGAADYAMAGAMATMACTDGFDTIIATPHQLGSYRENTGDYIRQRVVELQQFLDEQKIALQVLPGGDVRIESDMVRGLRQGSVLSLGDHGRHVLLELPHELYFPLEPVLKELRANRIVGILSHPERNRGLLAQPDIIPALVDGGCLMQVTAGSLLGSFGPGSQQMGAWMVKSGLTHFLATDAHSHKSRRPRMAKAFQQVEELAGHEMAEKLCCTFPRCVAEGQHVPEGRLSTGGSGKRRGWFSRLKSA
ncbi:MAG: hypothetical protein KDA60_08030 [Planctomycetales bacterium]|nr:hypothetical protein [Planctomycetales bacterium]